MRTSEHMHVTGMSISAGVHQLDESRDMVLKARLLM